jgi:IS1 family transposase
MTTSYHLTPKRKHYDVLEIDEFWTYVGNKKNKLWLIYAYHRTSGEIVAFVWGKRDLRTANKLRKRLNRLGITYDRIATDDWQSFITAFLQDTHDVGKGFTVGIEGNNCTLRHRIRRVFRKTFGNYVSAVSPRSCVTIGKPSTWPSSTSIMASFDASAYFVDHLLPLYLSPSAETDQNGNQYRHGYFGGGW